MGTIALFSWMATVLVGLVLFVIWAMEYDQEFHSSAATRLPVPVISAHAALGLGGLVAWGLYLAADDDRLAWATVADLGVVATLGVVMAVRWVGVYRAYAAPGSSPLTMVTVPPERHFPRPVIVIHGLLAVATLALVVAAVFFDGS